MRENFRLQVLCSVIGLLIFFTLVGYVFCYITELSSSNTEALRSVIESKMKGEF
jgi:hypothetical protein